MPSQNYNLDPETNDILRINRGLDLETRIRRRFNTEDVWTVDSLFRSVRDEGLQAEYVRVIGQRQVNKKEQYDPLRNNLTAKTKIYSQATEEENKINENFLEISRILTNKGYSWDRKVELLENQLGNINYTPSTKTELDLIQEMRNYVSCNRRIGNKKEKINSLINRLENKPTPVIVEYEEDEQPFSNHPEELLLRATETWITPYKTPALPTLVLPTPVLVEKEKPISVKITPRTKVLALTAGVLINFGIPQETNSGINYTLPSIVVEDGCIVQQPITINSYRLDLSVREPNSADIIREEFGLPVEGFFQSPVRETTLIGNAGRRKDPNKLQEGITEWRMHWGLDLIGNKEIYAPFPSAVCSVSGNSSYGNFLFGFNSQGAQWLVAHLEKFNVKFPKKSFVKRLLVRTFDPERLIIPTSKIRCEYVDDPSLVLATMGSTGKSTGVHAHYEIADCSEKVIDDTRFQKNKGMIYTGCPIIDPRPLLEEIHAFKEKTPLRTKKEEMRVLYNPT